MVSLQRQGRRDGKGEGGREGRMRARGEISLYFVGVVVVLAIAFYFHYTII